MSASLPGWREALVGLVRVVYLDLLWIAGCVLVVTAPAATTAMVAAVHRWRVDGEEPSARRFIADVRRRFASDLALGAIVVGVGVLLAVDLVAIGHMGDQRRPLLVAWLAVTIAVALVAVALPSASASAIPGSARVTGPLRLAAATVLRHPVPGLLAVCCCVAGAATVTISPVSLLAVPVAIAAVVDRLVTGSARSIRAADA
jgi:uncharacterized membrane protein YesL